MNRVILFAALASLLLAMGCVKPKQMTPEDFTGECIFPGGRDACDNDQSICNDFQSIVSGTQASLKECTSACNKLQLQEYSQYVAQSCNGTIDGATDLCEQYCHRKYGK